MTPDCSRFDLTPLREAAANWWRDQVGTLELSDAEGLALALSRQVAQTMLEVALGQTTGKATYQGSQRTCGACGGAARFVGYRSRWLRTLCGDQRVSRAYYHCAACHTGQIPWDEAEGLNERIFSPGVKALVAECCARLTHREVEELLSRVMGLKIEESSQQEVVGEIGERLRAAEAAQITACFDRLELPTPPADPPDRLYVAIDAAKAHTGGGWHDIKCGVIYAGIPPDPNPAPEGPAALIDRSGPKRYCARQEEAADFGKRIYVAALAAGLDQAKEVVVLGDGAEWIWNLASEHLHGATEILDYYHAAEHVWTLAATLYGAESPQGRRWAQTRCRDLKENGPKGLLRALSRRRGATPETREALRLARGYFKNHRRRMEYARFRARGLMIGSGPVEAACKTLVGQRLKGAGMRWSPCGADAMLANRTTVLNRQYAHLATYARAA